MKKPTPGRRGLRVSRPVRLPAIANRDRHELRGRLGVDPVILGLEVDHRVVVEVVELEGDRGAEVEAKFCARHRVGDYVARRATPPAAPVLRVADWATDIARLLEPALDVNAAGHGTSPPSPRKLVRNPG